MTYYICKARNSKNRYSVFRESAKKANFADNGERDVCGIVEK